MSTDLNLTTDSDNEKGRSQASPELLQFLKTEITNAEDFHQHLETSYAVSVYKEFERKFIDLRKRFKERAQLFSSPDYLFLNHSDLRKQAVDEILEFATVVAERFQQARENNQLNYSRCTSAIEDLIKAIKNLEKLSKQ